MLPVVQIPALVWAVCYIVAKAFVFGQVGVMKPRAFWAQPSCYHLFCDDEPALRRVLYVCPGLLTVHTTCAFKIHNSLQKAGPDPGQNTTEHWP